MQCPTCNSENTQRLEVVFHGGTQNINTNSATVGGAHGGAFGLGGAVTKTTGQSQTILAQKSAPPQKKPYKAGAIMLIIGLLFVASVPILGIILGGIGGFIIYSAYQFNSKSWPDLHQQWLESWLCNKCGTVYRHA